MPRSTFAFTLIALCCLTVRADDESASPQRFAMNPYHANIGHIAAVAKDGTLQLTELANPRFAFSQRLANLPDISEGLYLGLVGEEFTLSTEDTRLVRVQVVSVGEKRSATVRVDPDAAAKIEKGEQIVLFRPPGATTKQIEACPDIVAVDDGRETTVLGRNTVNVRARLASSQNNLKQIAIAVHNFHDVYNMFPPAVVYGPDGKPWHSWRVLLLPFLEEAALYEAYKFDEPWNGPNNKQLLSRMPEVFADPIYDGPNKDFYTHYAGVSGPTAAFPGSGIKMDAANPGQPLRNTKGAVRFRDFTDGTSNTLMIGTVGPEAKIPWMKPTDIVFEKTFPRPGEKGSFAAPYEIGGKNYGLFARCDGSVTRIASDIDAKTWQYLVERNDGNPVYYDEGDRTGGRASVRRGTKAMQYVEVYEEDGTLKARLIAE